VLLFQIIDILCYYFKLLIFYVIISNYWYFTWYWYL